MSYLRLAIFLLTGTCCRFFARASSRSFLIASRFAVFLDLDFCGRPNAFRRLAAIYINV